MAFNAENLVDGAMWPPGPPGGRLPDAATPEGKKFLGALRRSFELDGAPLRPLQQGQLGGRDSMRYSTLGSFDFAELMRNSTAGDVSLRDLLNASGQFSEHLQAMAGGAEGAGERRTFPPADGAVAALAIAPGEAPKDGLEAPSPLLKWTSDGSMMEELMKTYTAESQGGASPLRNNVSNTSALIAALLGEAPPEPVSASPGGEAPAGPTDALDPSYLPPAAPPGTMARPGAVGPGPHNLGPSEPPYAEPDFPGCSAALLSPSAAAMQAHAAGGAPAAAAPQPVAPVAAAAAQGRVEAEVRRGPGGPPPPTSGALDRDGPMVAGTVTSGWGQRAYMATPARITSGAHRPERGAIAAGPAPSALGAQPLPQSTVMGGRPSGGPVLGPGMYASLPEVAPLALHGDCATAEALPGRAPGTLRDGEAANGATSVQQPAERRAGAPHTTFPSGARPPGPARGSGSGGGIYTRAQEPYTVIADRQAREIQELERQLLAQMRASQLAAPPGALPGLGLASGYAPPPLDAGSATLPPYSHGWPSLGQLPPSGQPAGLLGPHPLPPADTEWLRQQTMGTRAPPVPSRPYTTNYHQTAAALPPQMGYVPSPASTPSASPALSADSTGGAAASYTSGRSPLGPGPAAGRPYRVPAPSAPSPLLPHATPLGAPLVDPTSASFAAALDAEHSAGSFARLAAAAATPTPSPPDAGVAAHAEAAAARGKAKRERSAPGCALTGAPKRSALSPLEAGGPPGFAAALATLPEDAAMDGEDSAEDDSGGGTTNNHSGGGGGNTFGSGGMPDPREARRALRKEKNRASAAASRARREAYTASLEEEVRKLQDEKSWLENQVQGQVPELRPQSAAALGVPRPPIRHLSV